MGFSRGPWALPIAGSRRMLRFNPRRGPSRCSRLLPRRLHIPAGKIIWWVWIRVCICNRRITRPGLTLRCRWRPRLILLQVMGSSIRQVIIVRRMTTISSTRRVQRRHQTSRDPARLRNQVRLRCLVLPQRRSRLRFRAHRRIGHSLLRTRRRPPPPTPARLTRRSTASMPWFPVAQANSRSRPQTSIAYFVGHPFLESDTTTDPPFSLGFFLFIFSSVFGTRRGKEDVFLPLSIFLPLYGRDDFAWAALWMYLTQLLYINNFLSTYPAFVVTRLRGLLLATSTT